ncbi:hypothetical protein HMPREF9709_01095 [Helcococcus kunzii ATCC 51366]|uniref:Uncharacterized protein n=1 Tax=Helcococcus kunzii ATCC 51366 TaxID=883114 RepID=H3NP34_9FIRM|nr:hypothetical protein HMPREF9709_01095 [Helcococcus kunzii ATCC 51366]
MYSLNESLCIAILTIVTFGALVLNIYVLAL